MKNMILALGCSFTDKNFKSSMLPANYPNEIKSGWPMWPQIFTERLIERDQKDYELRNVAKSGASMDYCVEKFFENWIVYKDRLKVVLWGGTNYFRLENFATGEKIMINQFSDESKAKKTITDAYLLDLARRTTSKQIYIRQAKINHERIVSIRDLCEGYNVDFLYYPLVPPFAEGKSYKKVGGRKYPIKRHEELNYLAKASPEAWRIITRDKNFLGTKNETYNLFLPSGFDWINWTMTCSHKIKTNALIRHNKEWPNDDGHPSATGQKMIAEKYWNHYVKNF